MFRFGCRLNNWLNNWLNNGGWLGFDFVFGFMFGFLRALNVFNWWRSVIEIIIVSWCRGFNVMHWLSLFLGLLSIDGYKSYDCGSK
jgi:hypothetical protein